MGWGIIVSIEVLRGEGANKVVNAKTKCVENQKQRQNADKIKKKRKRERELETDQENGSQKVREKVLPVLRRGVHLFRG